MKPHRLPFILDETNWAAWKDAIITTLDLRELYQFIDPKRPSMKASAQQNLAINAQFIASISASQHTHLGPRNGSVRQARDVWNHLIKVKEAKNSMARHNRWIDLIQMRLDNEASAREFITKFGETA
jgi:hypothetical protein